MKKILLGIGLLFFAFQNSNAQFAPQAYQAGSDAIHASDAKIKFWANACTFERGWKNIEDTTLGKPVMGNDSSVVGPPSTNVLSLGDGGYAIVTFEQAITNGEGPDFAIFENGFLHPIDSTLAYLELAFVEVSSDGIQFFRFPASSLTQDSTQIDNFGWLDASKIKNLAGKYIYGFGTPFDLEELKDQAGLDVDHITHVKIIDVVGSLNEGFARFDKDGNKINDPFPSAYPSGGFDLNAVAVLNGKPTKIKQLNSLSKVNIYPNPAQNVLHIKNPNAESINYRIVDLLGRVYAENAFFNAVTISLKEMNKGIYLIQLNNEKESFTEKLIIQ